MNSWFSVDHSLSQFSFLISTAFAYHRFLVGTDADDDDSASFSFSCIADLVVDLESLSLSKLVRVSSLVFAHSFFQLSLSLSTSTVKTMLIVSANHHDHLPLR